MDSVRHALTRKRKKNKSNDISESESFIDTEGDSDDKVLLNIDVGSSIEHSPINPQSQNLNTKHKKKKSHDHKLQQEMIKKLDTLVEVIKNQQEIQNEQLDIIKNKITFVEENNIKLEKPHIEEPKEVRDLIFAEPEPKTNKEKEEFNKFSRDVRLAFQISTSLFVLGILLTIGYFTVTMIDEYLGPFFWAVLLSILLRKPKALLLQLSIPMKTLETQNLGYFGVIKAKFILLSSKFISSYGIPLVCIILFGKSCCLITGWLCWVPWFSLAGSIIFGSFIVIIIVSISKSSSLDGFFTTILVFGFLIAITLFIFTFGFKAVTETGDFAFKIQDILEEKINDPKWGTMMSDYGITTESISEMIDTGRDHIEIWAEEQGYNITEIEETIIHYGSMLSDNSTIIDETLNNTDSLNTLNETEISTSYMDYIPSISISEIQEYYTMATDLVDFEAVGSIASSIGGFLFGTGSGIFDFFSSIISSLLGAVDVLLQFIVFIGAVFYFMESEDSFVDMAVKIVPVSKRQQQFLADTIHQNIIQVFVTSSLLSFSHGIAVLIYFSIFGLDFAYSSAFIVGAMALFPFTSAWLIYTPTLLIAYLHGSNYVIYIAIGLFLLEQALGFVDDKIFDLIPGSSPYLTGIGLAVGVSTFGVQGVLIGPMLIVTTKTLYEIFCLNIEQPEIQSPKKEKQE